MSAVKYVGDGAPDPGLSYGELILQSLRKYQNESKPAQVDAHFGTSMSYRELLLQSVQAAEGWRAIGLGPGDVIAVVSRNYHELFPLSIGASCAGITVAFIVPTSTTAEMQQNLSLTQPKMVVSELSKLSSALEASSPGCKHMLLGGELPPSAPAGIQTSLELMQMGAARHPDPDTYRAAEVGDRENHVPFILFSSGTTGMPKGVCLKDSAIGYISANLGSWLTVDSVSVILITSPMSWASGVWCLQYACMNGYTRIFTTYTDAETLMSTIQKYKVNCWTSSPAALTSIVKSKQRPQYDLSSLKVVLVGGSPTSAELHAQLERDVGCRVRLVYGATECGMTTGPRDVQTDRSPFGSMGSLAPWVHLRIVDPDSEKDIDTPNTVGELRVRSPYLMHSYKNNPEATANAFDSQGFYKTGDLAYVDENGYYFFVDRMKEMFKLWNYQIAPAELENVLLQHPGVGEVCVLGRPSGDGSDQVPVAFVVRASTAAGDSVTEADLKDLVASKLSDYKQLRGGVVFVEKLPRTVSGKVARKEMRQLLGSLTLTEPIK